MNCCARAHKWDVLHFLPQLPRTTSPTKSARRRGNAKSVPMSTPAGVPDGEQEFNAYQQIDPPRTRTWNLRLRRPPPYPLGQRANYKVINRKLFGITLGRSVLICGGGRADKQTDGQTDRETEIDRRTDKTGRQRDRT